MRANEEQAGSRKLPTLGQALLRLKCPFVGWKGRHDLEKGRREKMQTVLDDFFFFFFFFGVLTSLPTIRLGGPTAFLGICIPATLRATRATRGGILGDLFGIALALDSVVLAMAKSF